MKRSKETWIISKVKYYWAFCSKTTQGLSAILKNIYPAHEHQRFHDAFDVISLSQSAVFPPCPSRHVPFPKKIAMHYGIFVQGLPKPPSRFRLKLSRLICKSCCDLIAGWVMHSIELFNVSVDNDSSSVRLSEAKSLIQ